MELVALILGMFFGLTPVILFVVVPIAKEIYIREKMLSLEQDGQGGVFIDRNGRKVILYPKERPSLNARNGERRSRR